MNVRASTACARCGAFHLLEEFPVGGFARHAGRYVRIIEWSQQGGPLWYRIQPGDELRESRQNVDPCELEAIKPFPVNDGSVTGRLQVLLTELTNAPIKGRIAAEVGIASPLLSAIKTTEDGERAVLAVNALAMVGIVRHDAAELVKASARISTLEDEIYAARARVQTVLVALTQNRK